MALVNRIAGHKGRVTVLHNELQGTAPGDQSDIDSLVEEVKSQAAIVSKLYDDLIGSTTDNDVVVKYITDQSTYSLQVRKLLKPFSTTSSTGGGTGANTVATAVKLPVIELPTFNGDVTCWNSFWEQFSTLVHKRTDIGDVAKFHYLRSVLKEQALKLVHNFETTAVNYEAAVELLQNTYNLPGRGIREFSKRLLHIKRPSHNAVELLEFRAELESDLRSLEGLGCDIDKAGFLIVALLTEKLSSKTVEQINLKTQSDYPELKPFRDGLTAVINSLSALDTIQSVKPDKEKTKPKFKWYQESPLKSTQVGQYAVNTNVKQNPNPSQVHTSTDQYVVQAQTVTSAAGKETNQIKSTSKPKLECLFCSGVHTSIKCNQYPTIKARKDRLNTLSRCEQCCRKKDNNHVCQLNTCPRCKESVHHSFLCPKIGSNAQVCLVKTNVKNSKTALPVATFQVHKSKKRSPLKVLLDTGSQRTFVRDTVVQKLNLKPIGKVNLKVEGFLNESGYVDYDVVNLPVKIGRQYIKVQALVTSKLPVNLQVLGLSKATNHLRKQIRLADPNIQSDQINDLDMLCGSDYYFRIIKGHARVAGIDLLKSAAGYIIAGNIPERFQSTTTVSQNIAIVTRIGVDEVSVLDESSKLWELDTIGITANESTPEERITVTSFQNTVQYQDNQYLVKLPWKADIKQCLPTNYNLALTRTKGTYDQLRKQAGHLEQYNQIINSQLDAGFIEEVENPVVHSDTHYLSHLRVLRDSSTTPMRMVFDCSAKVKGGISLNDCLMTGPSLVEQLGKVLLKFRTNKYAYSSDISKAFLRIGLQTGDRDYTRFLWPSNINNFQSPMKTYRFKSVLFGATCSPFLLQATIQHHFNTKYSDHEYSNVLKDTLYVDNIQGTCNDENTAVQLYQAANQIFQEANLPLQQWRSNSSKLNDIIIQDYPTEDPTQNTKLLGLYWDIHNDTLSLNTVEWKPVYTKRQLVSECSKIYDPLGLLTPITIALKILMQKAWVDKLDWDEILPKSLQVEFQNVIKGIGEVHAFKFPRRVCEEGRDYQLHIFSDASTKAYGAVAYLVSTNETPYLLTSKARVAPLKTKTLPQLELTAVLVAARLARYIQETLKRVSITETFLWTDSEITLSWIINNKSDIVYVRNRVSEILDLVPLAKYRYVSTEANPADCLTRGMSMNMLLKNPIWFHGPRWIQDSNSWPTQKPNIIACTVATLEPSIPSIIDCSRYSTLLKLVKVTRIVLKVKDKFLGKLVNQRIIQSTDPLKFLVKMVQQKEYANIYQYLKQTSSSGKVPEMVKTLSLCLQDDIIICLGRLGKAQMESFTKYPMLLPKKHALTNLIIDTCHLRSLHGGVQETLTDVRNEFWIPQGRQQVKSRLKTCKICKTLEGRNYQLPPSPPLPMERVTHTRPFTVVGIDYTGSITISKTSTVPTKVYVCLFTCAVTRAVHLELVEDLTAEAFLLAFRRFAARRSCPSVIISDNATNFKAGAEFLQNIPMQPQVVQELERRNIRWKFITPRSPWQGGFYERLIGIVKGCLRKVLFRRKISMGELHTILTEVEARVNNRPLTYVNELPDNLETITPSHLLCGHRINLSPIVPYIEGDDDEYNSSPQALNERYKYIQRILMRWQKLWANEYLTSLREKHYGNRDPSRRFQQQLKVGDVVLLHSETPRETWPLARILEVYPDNQGMIRVVKVKTCQGELIRSIKFLYPLEQGPVGNDGMAPESDRDESLPPTVIDHDTLTGSVPEDSDTEPEQPQDQNVLVGRRAARLCRDWLRGVCADEVTDSDD